jgi:hypothetical protein
MTVQICYVKTIVGWWNLYLVSNDPNPPVLVTVSPDKMSELFTGLSAKARLGCGELSISQALQLFGDRLKEARIA